MKYTVVLASILISVFALPITKIALTDEQKAQAKKDIIETVNQIIPKLSSDAQTAANKIVSIIENESGDDDETTKKAIESIVSEQTPEVKKELASLLFPIAAKGFQVLTTEQKAQVQNLIKTDIIATAKIGFAKLSPEAQSAGESIIAAVENVDANDATALSQKVEGILGEQSSEVKQELLSSVPVLNGLKDLTDEQKAQIATKLNEKVATLSQDAQDAFNKLKDTVSANEGNSEALKTQVLSVVSELSDPVKKEFADAFVAKPLIQTRPAFNIQSLPAQLSLNV